MSSFLMPNLRGEADTRIDMLGCLAPDAVLPWEQTDAGLRIVVPYSAKITTGFFTRRCFPVTTLIRSRFVQFWSRWNEDESSEHGCAQPIRN